MRLASKAWPITLLILWAGVVEVLALEVDLRAAEFAAQALGVVDRAGAADKVRQLLLELGDEVGSLR